MNSNRGEETVRTPPLVKAGKVPQVLARDTKPTLLPPSGERQTRGRTARPPQARESAEAHSCGDCMVSMAGSEKPERLRWQSPWNSGRT